MNKTFRQNGLAWTMLIVGTLISIWAGAQIKRSIDDDTNRQFAFVCDQVALKIRERLSAYALTLRGGVGLFNASNQVSREDWRTYTETLRAQDSIPGVQGIGFSLLIKPDELAEHVSRIRSQGFPEYRVYPPGDRAAYSSILYLEPFRDRNLRAFGYDMFSEAIRRQAMEQARDNGEAALSGKVELVQETGTEIQAGTLMYMPVYRGGKTPATLDERRSALLGWVYSPYRMNDLMGGILGDWEHREGQDIRLRVYSGAQMIPASLLYTSKAAHVADLDMQSHQQRIVDFNGRQWLLVFERSKTRLGLDYAPAWGSLLGGITLSGLLFGLMRAVTNTQKNAVRIADELTQQIRSREQQVAEAEARWRFALESSGDGVWDWNVVDDKVFFSKRWKEMLGFADYEIGDDSAEWSKRIHPEDRAETFRILQDHFNNLIPIYAAEFRFICKNGNIKWILARGSVIERDADGKPRRMIGTQTDITMRKRLEDSLRQTQQELQEAQRIARVGSWKLDLATQDVRWSDELFKMFGLPIRGLAPGFESHSRLFAAESWARLETAIANTRETGAPYELELALQRDDGGNGWILVRGEAVRDTNGAIVALRGVAADITERKQAEILLQTCNLENQRVRDALDDASSLICIKDANAVYVYANRALLQLLRCSLEQLVGGDDARVFPQTTAERLRDIERRVLVGERTLETIEFIDADGRARVFLDARAPLFDHDGRITGIIGISTEMRELSSLDRLAVH